MRSAAMRDPSSSGSADMENWNEIKVWRKARRDDLIARRLALSDKQRHERNDRITGFLHGGFLLGAGSVVGFCWPYKGVFDARFAIGHWRARGAMAALPVVVEKGHPLQFRKWWPGAPMTPGVYDIPVPDATEILLPDAAVIPMNGFDEQGYRLGYGGGYFDRTLAALERRVLAIGVSYEALRLHTIHPQPHDIPMDFIVTENGIYRAGGGRLALLNAEECRAHAKSLLEGRRLPRRMAESSRSRPRFSHEIAQNDLGKSQMMTTVELVGLLNMLLEAERAGAKVLAAFLQDYEPDTPAWSQLLAVQRDEARNCSILIDLIRRMSGIPSTATGAFLNKALAVEDRIARLQFLNRGQQWVARKINEALPYVEQGFARGALFAMQESHLLNIEACDVLVDALEAHDSNA